MNEDDGGEHPGVQRFMKRELPFWSTWALISWLGMSQMTDFLDPLVTSTALISFAGLFAAISRYRKGFVGWFSIAYGAICAVLLFWCLIVEVGETRRISAEIREPCKKFRAKIIADGGNSTASDAYQALHCRWFVDAWPFNI